MTRVIYYIILAHNGPHDPVDWFLSEWSPSDYFGY